MTPTPTATWMSSSVADRNLLSDIAYEAIVETYVDVHAIPIFWKEWEDPEQHRNPDFVRAIRRDGIAIEGETTRASPWLMTASRPKPMELVGMRKDRQGLVWKTA